MTQIEGYKPDLIGKRVRHNCDDPDCTLQGTVLDMVPNPAKPLSEDPIQWYVVVKFDSHKDLPEDYTQPVNIDTVKVINGE